MAEIIPVSKIVNHAFRKERREEKLLILDLHAIPSEYISTDGITPYTHKIIQALRIGIRVPGCRLEIPKPTLVKKDQTK